MLKLRGASAARRGRSRRAGFARPLAGAPLPQGATAPTAHQLAALCKHIEAAPLPPRSAKPFVIPLGADWRTQGSWLGRYGRYWMCLFAGQYPGAGDMVWRPGTSACSEADFIGPHCHAGDSIRLFPTWPFSNKRRVLELPPIYDQIAAADHIPGSGGGDRREAEIDDHGEAYSPYWQGPDVNVAFEIPRGEHVLSLYEFNKDGHSGQNMRRDYVLSTRAYRPGLQVMHIVYWGRRLGWRIAAQHSSAFYVRPTAVVGRVAQFWGGVWDKFLVRGPMTLLVRVGRNYSFNTILCGAALDPLNEHPAPYYYGLRSWRKALAEMAMKRAALRAAWAAASARGRPAGSGRTLTQRLLRDEEFLAYANPQLWASSQRLAYTLLYRWNAAATSSGRLGGAERGRVDYRLDLFRQWEAQEQRLGITTSRHIEKSLRWNGNNQYYGGMGFSVIRHWVLAHNKKSGNGTR